MAQSALRARPVAEIVRSAVLQRIGHALHGTVGDPGSAQRDDAGYSAHSLAIRPVWLSAGMTRAPLLRRPKLRHRGLIIERTILEQVCGVRKALRRVNVHPEAVADIHRLHLAFSNQLADCSGE